LQFSRAEAPLGSTRCGDLLRRHCARAAATSRHPITWCCRGHHVADRLRERRCSRAHQRENDLVLFVW